jgi:AraC-like DNA-binding protein
MKLSLIDPLEFTQVELNNDEGITKTPEVLQQAIHYGDATLGSVDCTLISTSNVSIFSGIINLQEAVKLKTLALENSVNFPFMLEGSIESHFHSYPQKQQLRANSHNAIHLVDTEGEHLLPKGQINTFHLSLGSGYFSENFLSDDRITDKLKNSIHAAKPQVASPLPGLIGPEMKTVIHQILTNPYQGAMKKMFVELKALELITMQVYQFGNQSNSSYKLTVPHQDLAYAVKEFLDRHYLQVWTLPDLAKKFGTNIQTLKTCFKATFGINMFAYYQTLRMEFARKLLMDRKQQIAEISEFLGYSHQNHFSAAFKKYFGISPSKIH